MATIREWRNDEWERGNKATTQETLQYNAKRILKGADSIENQVTPGGGEQNFSRCLVCHSSLVPNVEYIIHMSGFTVEDIIEIIRTDKELELLKN